MKIKENILWNAFGTATTLAITIVTIPQLVAHFGHERFGVLSLALILIGYFSLFDFGLGRALTHFTSRYSEDKSYDNLSGIIISGILGLIIIGSLIGLLLYYTAPWLVEEKLQLSDQIKNETLFIFNILAVSIPSIVLSTGLIGILEGFHRFDLINIIKTPLVVITNLLILAALPFTNTLSDIVIIIAAGRWLLLALLLLVSFLQYNHIFKGTNHAIHYFKKLITYGGWISISNIVGPFLTYLGRIGIAFLLTVDHVAYYSIPYDVIIYMLIIPRTYTTVLFPIFSKYHHTQSNETLTLYKKWLLYTFLSMLPICILSLLIAKPGLSLWISPDFSEASHLVAYILTIGVFINSFGYISQSLIQAYGRPDLTAKLHIFELLLYIPYFIYFTKTYGIEGAALSWVLRVFISTILLTYIANKFVLRTSTPKGAQ